MNKIVIRSCLSGLLLLHINTAFAVKPDNILTPFKDVEHETEMYSDVTEMFVKTDQNKCMDVDLEYVSTYLSPFINTVAIDPETNTLENSYTARTLIETLNGRYAIYHSGGRYDFKLMLADISSDRPYPPTLQIYHNVAHFVYNWYTYDADANIIEISYLIPIKNCDIRDEYRPYIQYVEQYRLEPSFPYLGRKDMYYTEIRSGWCPSGSTPDIPKISIGNLFPGWNIWDSSESDIDFDKIREITQSVDKSFYMYPDPNTLDLLD